MSLDALIIGSGPDELVAAHTLARSGMRVRVLRSASSLQHTGWMPPRIVRELELLQHGYAIQTSDPWAVAPLAGGGRLELFHDIARSADAIRRVSSRDAAKWPEFCVRMHALADVLEHLYDEPPPDPLTHERRGYLDLARTAWRVRKLGRAGIEDLLRVLPMSIADLLDDWFESDALKGVLGAAGVMHLHQGPRSGGTALNFLHHGVGSPTGVFRPPRSNAHAVLSALPGVDMIDAHVARIDVEHGRAVSVVLANGDVLAASLIISGAHPQRTLTEWIDTGWLDPGLVRSVRNIRSRGVVTKVALTLDANPGFTTLVIAPSLNDLERAYDAAKYGEISAAPYIEASAVESSEGARHRVDVHVQYTPHTLTWDTDLATQLARRVVARIGDEAPGFSSRVIEQHVLTPHDLEKMYACPQGQAYHAEVALDQWLWMRPVPQLARYRTPIAGLYLCGPAMHPGGGILGASGTHAARAALRDLSAGLK
ncbi:MAG: NAD(P)/FAD-dependent oxidoreductase [Pseudomonadota bacterium]